MYVFICPLWRPRHLRIEGSLESNHLVASNMGSVSCLNKTKPEEDWKRDEERLSFLTSPPQSATEKDGQPCFFCLFVRFVDIWLRTEFKAVEAGKRKKKERQKKKKRKKNMMKQKMTGNREAYRYLVAIFISVSSLLLNSFSSFWRKQKSAIH